MVIEAGLPNRVTDAFCDGTLSLSDDTRYRRDEHGSSVVAVEKEQKVDMIRHDDVVINIDGGINLVNPDTNP